MTTLYILDILTILVAIVVLVVLLNRPDITQLEWDRIKTAVKRDVLTTETFSYDEIRTLLEMAHERIEHDKQVVLERSNKLAAAFEGDLKSLLDGHSAEDNAAVFGTPTVVTTTETPSIRVTLKAPTEAPKE